MYREKEREMEKYIYIYIHTDIIPPLYQHCISIVPAFCMRYIGIAHGASIVPAFYQHCIALITYAEVMVPADRMPHVTCTSLGLWPLPQS